MTLYEMREGRFLEQNDYYHIFKDHFRTGYLQMHTYIHAIKQAMKDMKSYNALLKKYKKYPAKNQNPGKPRFKHDKNLMEATFLKTAIRIRNGHLLLSIGKKMKTDKQIKAIDVILPDEVYGFLSDKILKMVKVSYDKNIDKYMTRFVYEVNEPKLKESGDMMAIDLGVKNLAAITFMNSTDQYLLDGNVLKSKIATFNKNLKESYSKEMLCTGSKYFKLTKKMKKQMRDRKGYIDNYIHTASKKIIEIAKKHDVQTLVIGDFKSIKSENKAKYFVQIPHSRLIKQLAYKCKLQGIEFVMQNESYTSVVSALDLDHVSKDYADRSKRVKRGLFRAKAEIINADINGSLNIMRKYDNYKNIPRLINEVRDKGFRENPIRLLVI
jgi:IS605 OrfB family transposase